MHVKKDIINNDEIYIVSNILKSFILCVKH